MELLTTDKIKVVCQGKFTKTSLRLFASYGVACQMPHSGGFPVNTCSIYACISMVVSVHYSPLIGLLGGGGGEMMDNLAEIFFQLNFFFCLQEAVVSSSGMGRDVHYLMLSTQHFQWSSNNIAVHIMCKIRTVCQ